MLPVCLFTNINKYTHAHTTIFLFLSLFTPKLIYNFTVWHPDFFNYQNTLQITPYQHVKIFPLPFLQLNILKTSMRYF